MKRAAALAALILFFCGCSSMKEEASRYAAGDFVAYRYSGSYRKEPITLTEKVLSKEGNKLCILVVWKSGAETRTWKQFVTDTAYNRTNNIVDRLVLVENGIEKELPNRENVDLFRLYDGTFLMPQRPPELVKEEVKSVSVCGRQYNCRVKTYRTRVSGQRATMTVAESADFTWTTVYSRYEALHGGVLYSAEVTGCGSEKK